MAEWAYKNLVVLERVGKLLNDACRGTDSDFDDDRNLGYVEKLRSRYWRGTDAIQRLEEEIADEWCDDLQAYPSDLVAKAYRLWRNSNKTYAPPSAGVLMDCVKAELADRNKLRLQAWDAIEAGRVFQPRQIISEKERKSVIDMMAETSERLTGKKPIIRRPRRSSEEKAAHRQSQINLLRSEPST